VCNALGSKDQTMLGFFVLFLSLLMVIFLKIKDKETLDRCL